MGASVGVVLSGAFDKTWDQLCVGDELTTAARTITEADVVTFAELTGDRHPLHVDREWAMRSPFGERIAQGLLIVAYAFGLAPLNPARVVVVRRLRDVAFPRPVRIGDTIRARCRVRELKPVDDDLGLVDWAWEVVNQDDELNVRLAVELLWRRW